MICPICQYQGDTFGILESDCLFLPIDGLDQHLVRHKCPDCGVIFGTQQMLNLSKEKLGEAYQKVFDSGYRDGDEASIMREVANLLALSPNPNGIYLNWGSQISPAGNKAKELGYTLLNYDPFMKIDTLSKEKINEIKFDGIISHNLLEHLQDPISELRLMKSLLKPGASMVHSTPCYKYCYEFTKFHLFFFEGKSLDIICEKAGLTYKYLIKDQDPEVIKFDQV